MFRILIFLCLHSTTFANPLIGDETAGITPAGETEFPFIVSIGIKDIGDRCTGTLITHWHVLTAEHCVRVRKTSSIYVIVGSNDLKNPGKGQKQMLDISKHKGVITFNAWATRTNNQHLMRYSANDIAILTLMNKADTTIPLPTISPHTDDQLYGRTAVTVGWGELSDGGNKPYLLHKASLRIMDRTECKDNMEAFKEDRDDVHDSELCTNADPQVILGHGDSGGPLLIDGNVIIGVNEGMCPKGVTPIPTNAFNLHMSIDYYRQFIDSVTTGHRCG